MRDHHFLKPITIALVIFLILPIFATRASQDFDGQSRKPSSRPAQRESLRAEQPPASFLARSSWGGFPLGFPAIIAAKPFSPTLNSNALSSTQSIFNYSCGLKEDFCITQYRFSFPRPFSSIYNTAIETSYLYGSTEFGALRPHHGIDILNLTGTPVLAVEDGTVVVAGNDGHSSYGPWENFYGNLVVLEHRMPGTEEPIYTLYGHLSTVQVRVGQKVNGGESIGEVGSTGTALGSHLHFEVRVGANQYDDTRNPALWFIPRTDENGQQYGALAGLLSNAQGDPIYATLKLEYYLDIEGSPDTIFYVETYSPEMKLVRTNDLNKENFVLVDLPPGHYRIVLNASGKWTERWVEVEPGKLSFVRIVSDKK